MRISTRAGAGEAVRVVARLDNGDELVLDLEDELVLPPDHGIHSISLWPDKGYWPSIVFREFPEVLYLEPLPERDRRPWWRAAIGAVEPARTDGAGICVGIVDGPMGDRRGLQRMKLVSLTGSPATSGHPGSHAQRVALIIGGDGSGDSQTGMAPGAELVHCDVSAYPAGGSSDAWSNGRIASAITMLAGDYGATIINVSGGSFHAANAGLELAVELASDLGAICIAAVGNAGHRPVAIPARFPSAVGVGAFGNHDLSLPRTLNQYLEVEAREKGWFHGDDPMYYSSGTNSIGAGLDMLAPGVGVTVALKSGHICTTYGSSFASPIVSGALAVALAGDRQHRALEGRRRSDYARERLWAMCRPAGAGEWIGRGLLRVVP